jgi:hypothetical protein
MYGHYSHSLSNVTKRIDNPDVYAFFYQYFYHPFFNDTHRTRSQFFEFLLLQPYINDLLARCFKQQATAALNLMYLWLSERQL